MAKIVDRNAPLAAERTASIAIVDDEGAVRDALSNLLESAGWNAYAYESAVDFLDSPERGTVSCLVTDVQMPGMDGLELQHRVMTSSHAVPVIIMTAFPRDAVRRRARQQGASAFFTKPFEGGLLIASIRGALVRAGYP